MSKPTHGLLLALAATLGLAAAASGCAAPSEPHTGTFRLGLRDDISGWFRLRIYDSQPDEALNGSVIFDTGCIDARSRTYELTGIPSGTDRWVAIEAFGSVQCSPDTRTEVGIRGGVVIPEGAAGPYYHVSMLTVGGVSALPEDLNLSAAVATQVDFCDSDAQCAQFSDTHRCFDGQKPTYWCVPSCSSNADCTAMHPKAQCEVSTGWCFLRSPYPLNLSEPRAFGFSTTRSDGAVAFVGGFGQIAASALRPGATYAEVFDPSTGVFAKLDTPALDGHGAGLSGFAPLGDDRVVAAGGVLTALATWQGEGGSFSFSFGDLSADDCSGLSGSGCVPNLSHDLIVLDLMTGAAAVSELPIPLVQPAVTSLGGGRFLLLGGLATAASGAGVEASDRAWLCTASDDQTATCTEAGPMKAARAGAATTCLDPACGQVLVFGGAAQGKPVAEVATVDGDTVSFAQLTATGLPQRVYAPQLCGLRLAAGSTKGSGPSAFNPVGLVVSDGAVSAAPLSNVAIDGLPLWPAVASLPDGDCWIFGGLNQQGRPSDVAFRFTADTVDPSTFTLWRGRFGAMAGAVTAGPLKGAVLVGGGLALAGSPNGAGGVDLVRGAEVLLP